MNFDKHSVEKRHNQRFLGIFLMFVVIAVVIGIFSAVSIANISGYGVFDFLKADKTLSSYSCVDSDGGIIPGMPGVCTDPTGTYKDSCIATSDDLLEYYCSKPENICKKTIIDCLEGNPACSMATCASALSNWDYRIMKAAFIPSNITSITFETIDYNRYPFTITQFNTGYLTFSNNINETECVIANTLLSNVNRVNKTARFLLRSLSNNYPFGDSFTLRIGETRNTNGLSVTLVDITPDNIKIKLNYDTRTYPYNQLGPCK